MTVRACLWQHDGDRGPSPPGPPRDPTVYHNNVRRWPGMQPLPQLCNFGPLLQPSCSTAWEDGSRGARVLMGALLRRCCVQGMAPDSAQGPSLNHSCRKRAGGPQHPIACPGPWPARCPAGPKPKPPEPDSLLGLGGDGCKGRKWFVPSWVVAGGPSSVPWG